VRNGEVPDAELISMIKDRIAKNDRPRMWFNPGAGSAASGPEAWNDPLLRETISPQQIQEHLGRGDQGHDSGIGRPGAA
jgi:hypothetical protein